VAENIEANLSADTTQIARGTVVEHQVTPYAPGPASFVRAHAGGSNFPLASYAPMPRPAPRPAPVLSEPQLRARLAELIEARRVRENEFWTTSLAATGGRTGPSPRYRG
jgi:hypothetical protein